MIASCIWVTDDSIIIGDCNDIYALSMKHVLTHALIMINYQLLKTPSYHPLSSLVGGFLEEDHAICESISAHIDLFDFT